MAPGQGWSWRFSGMSIAALGNISIQLNYLSVSVVLLLLEKIFGSTPDWATSLLTSTIFAGSVLGMVSLGYLGDTLGRHTAMVLTLTIVAFSALASAFLDLALSSDGIYGSIVLWRFFLGVGIGGIYPLSGSHAYEDDATGGNKLQRVGWSVFWQQPGQCFVYCLALMLLLLFGTSHYRVQFRLMLAFGAVPSLVTLPSAVADMRTHKHEAASAFTSESLSQCLRKPVIMRALLGASITWFVFDIYVYAITLYSPVILDELFGSTETLSSNDLENLLSVAITIPTAALSVWLLGRMPIKRLQTVGFVIAALSFVVMGTVWHNSKSTAVKFLTFLLLKLFTFVGVPTTTFTMPNQLFPKEIRSTCTGIAAASGKLGAFVGAFTMPYMYTWVGMGFAFYMCALCAVLGLGLTLWLIPDRPLTLSSSDPSLAGAGAGAGTRAGAPHPSDDEEASLLDKSRPPQRHV